METIKHIRIYQNQYDNLKAYLSEYAGDDAPFGSLTDALRLALAIGMRFKLSQDLPSGSHASSANIENIDPKKHLRLGLTDETSASSVAAGGLNYLLERLDKGQHIDQIMGDLIDSRKSKHA